MRPATIRREETAAAAPEATTRPSQRTGPVRSTARIGAAAFACFLGAGMCGGELASTASAQTFTGLGFLPGPGFSLGYGVSGDGSVVVGESGNNYPGPFTAFRWTGAGGMVSLGTLPDEPSSFASGISGDGSVIVGASGYF